MLYYSKVEGNWCITCEYWYFLVMLSLLQSLASYWFFLKRFIIKLPRFFSSRCFSWYKL